MQINWRHPPLVTSAGVGCLLAAVTLNVDGYGAMMGALWVAWGITTIVSVRQAMRSES